MLEEKLMQEEMNVAQSIASETYFQTVFRRFKRHRLGYYSLIFLGILVFMIILVPLISPYHPDAIVGSYSQAPSWKHWLGTDQVGRDMFTRLFTGAGVSLLVSVSATVMSTTLGILLGLVSGYFGSWVDQVVMRVTDVVMSFPYLLLVLVAAAIFGPGLVNMIIILGIVDWPSMARLVRSNVISVRERNYIQGSKVAGMPNMYIMFRDILPNAMAPVLINATSILALTMLDEAALSFLAMGVQPPTASLGNLLNVAQSFSVLRNYIWMWLPPGLMIILLVVSINFVGDALRDALDPQSKLQM